MSDRGYFLTITVLFYVVLFVIFLGVTTFVVYKTNFFDKQSSANLFKFKDFVSAKESVLQDQDSLNFWCTTFFFYDFLDLNPSYNGIYKKTYCEDYAQKRII